MSDDQIIIDGSYGEGGGQILRTGLAMSAITKCTVSINNIRANRPRPGLANQHLTGLHALQRICGARTEGDKVGSTSISFSPENIKHGDYEFNVGTAGSITLVLQTVLPALASVKGHSKLLVTGGTDVKWSPPMDYYHLVLFPLLKRFGVDCRLQINKRGYYPKGGGEVEVFIDSSGEFGSVALKEPHKITDISGLINITGLPMAIAERIRSSVIRYLPNRYSSTTRIEIKYLKGGRSQGVGLVLAASNGNSIIGASSLGERGKSAEKVGEEAVNQLMREMEGGGSVDTYASDQLLPYLAFSKPGSCYSARELTNHANTNIRTIQHFLSNVFEIEEGTKVTRISKK